MVFGILLLIGCQSTPEESGEFDCKEQADATCSAEADNGDDRGYNPCLVNKKLPICKK